MLPVVLRLVASAWAAACLVAASAPVPDFTALERAVAADPENLRIAAAYRQSVVQATSFDRSIQFLDNLARRTHGPNVHISLALAYVDKVPTSGEIRRLYLRRAAMNELTKAIERRPSVLAYLVRGVFYIYYNNFIFKRSPRGISDLDIVVTRVTSNTN